MKVISGLYKGRTIEGQNIDGTRPTMERVKESSLYQKYQAVQYEDAEVKFVPYYTWANRGENEMMVWMRS